MKSALAKKLKEFESKAKCVPNSCSDIWKMLTHFLLSHGAKRQKAEDILKSSVLNNVLNFFTTVLAKGARQ